MKQTTDRLIITDLAPEMAEALHRGSLDKATRQFLPDEVFETVDIAREVIDDLIGCYGNEAPQVHPMLLHDGALVGYVQLVPCEDGWEIGYHVSAAHRGHGYAEEAVKAFLPVMMAERGISEVAGICVRENAASVRVLEKCGFEKVYEGNGVYQGVVRPVVKMVYRL